MAQTTTTSAVTTATATRQTLHELDAGIRRMRLHLEGLQNDQARLQRAESTLAEVLGWNHPLVTDLHDEIDTTYARQCAKLLSDIDSLKRARRQQAQFIETQAETPTTHA